MGNNQEAGMFALLSEDLCAWRENSQNRSTAPMNNKRIQPNGLTSHPALCMLFRLNSQQFPLGFVEDQFQTTTAINACVPNHNQEVFLLRNSSLVPGRLMPAMRTPQKADFSLAQRAVDVGASKHFEIIEPFVSLVCKPITRPDPL
jgi:hypothetical protein